MISVSLVKVRKKRNFHLFFSILIVLAEETADSNTILMTSITSMMNWKNQKQKANKRRKKY